MQVTRTQLTTEEVLTQEVKDHALPWKAWLASHPAEWSTGETEAQAIARLWRRHDLPREEAVLIAEKGNHCEH